MRRLFAIVFFLVTFSGHAVATHIYSVELSYRHVSDSTYEITAQMLFYCPFCSGPPANITIKAQSDSFGITNTLIFNRLPYSTSIPITENWESQCDMSPQYYIEEYYYRGNWTSPKKARDWEFYYEVCCTHQMDNRNAAAIRYKAGLNNFDFPDTIHKNISPLFHTRRPNVPGYTHDTVINPAIASLCAGMQKPSINAAREYQGDSVSYAFVTPDNSFGNPVAYRNSYSLSDPFPQIAGPITVNPLTGSISFLPDNPDSTGYYGLTIRATEWRNDTIFSGSSYSVVPRQIGFAERNLFIHVNDSSDCYQDTVKIKDRFISKKSSDSTLTVSFAKENFFSNGTYIARIRTNTISTDGSEFRIVDSCNYVAPYDTTVKFIPVKSVSWQEQGGFTPELKLKIDGEFGCCDDYHIVLKRGTDLDVLQTECGVWLQEDEAGKIHILDTAYTDLGPDKSYCKGAVFTRMLDAGFGLIYSYRWSTGDSTQTIQVNTPGTYSVEVMSEFCSASDTMRILNRNCDTTTSAGGPSNTSSSTEKDSLGTSVAVHNFKQALVKIYPNPSNGLFNVESTGIVFTRFDIYSSQGQVVKSLQSTGGITSIDLSGFETGMYLLRLFTEENHVSTFNLIVN